MTYKFCILFFLSFCCSFSVFSTDKKKVANSGYSAKKAKTTKASALKQESLTAGTVEIQAADASDYYSSLNGNELIELMGKNVNDVAIQRVINSIKSDFELSNSAGNIMYLWRNEGLSFRFDNKSTLQQISFLNSKEIMGAFCSAFHNELPKGLSFNKTRNQIEEIIGKPFTASSPVGDEKFYASYSIENGIYNFMITYNTNSSAEMNSVINEILVMKSENKINNTAHIFETNSVKENLSIKESTNGKSETNAIIDTKNAISYIGKYRNDADLSKFVTNLGTKEVEIIDYEQSSQYINKREGIILNYDNSSILASVIFVNSTQYLGEACSQYQGKLPDGVNFSLNMQEVEERLGTPIQTSNNTEALYWEMYSVNNGSDAMYITYKTKNSAIKSALISDIRVEKLK